MSVDLSDEGLGPLTLHALQNASGVHLTLDAADQRAGRAARLGPGTVRRLWDERDRLRPHREPEVQRIDLAQPVLSAARASVALRARGGSSAR